MDTSELLEEWHALNEKEHGLDLRDVEGLRELMEHRKRILFLLMQKGVTQMDGKWILDQYTDLAQKLRQASE